jgi:hypothetical protein
VSLTIVNLANYIIHSLQSLCFSICPAPQPCHLGLSIYHTHDSSHTPIVLCILICCCISLLHTRADSSIDIAQNIRTHLAPIINLLHGGSLPLAVPYTLIHPYTSLCNTFCPTSNCSCYSRQWYYQLEVTDEIGER